MEPPLKYNQIQVDQDEIPYREESGSRLFVSTKHPITHIFFDARSIINRYFFYPSLHIVEFDVR